MHLRRVKALRWAMAASMMTHSMTHRRAAGAAGAVAAAAAEAEPGMRATGSRMAGQMLETRMHRLRSVYPAKGIVGLRKNSVLEDKVLLTDLLLLSHVSGPSQEGIICRPLHVGAEQFRPFCCFLPMCSLGHHAKVAACIRRQRSHTTMDLGAAGAGEAAAAAVGTLIVGTARQLHMTAAASQAEAAGAAGVAGAEAGKVSYPFLDMNGFKEEIACWATPSHLFAVHAQISERVCAMQETRYRRSGRASRRRCRRLPQAPS